MKTRKMYLNNECTHREYYAQFVNEDILCLIRLWFSVEELRKAYEEDEHLNSIPLGKWDALAKSLTLVKKLLIEAGDYLTLAVGVCIAKEAAMQIIHSSQQS